MTFPIFKLSKYIDFDEVLMTNVDDDSFVVTSPEYFRGFKTEGVACCYAFIAIITEEGEGGLIPVSLGHYVPGESIEEEDIKEEDIEDERLSVESFLDKMNDEIRSTLGDVTVQYIVLGGARSSRCTLLGIKNLSNEGRADYCISSVYTDLSSNEEGSIDIFINRKGICYQQYSELKASYENNIVEPDAMVEFADDASVAEAKPRSRLTKKGIE
ncbi:MAG: hypothetical protein HON32_00600 [Francisellaceae bacterium]|jgi:hypothetical protein|nr:hypothetical protein [Francisellaceae bacterium]MBT6538013.1 hypothetical protein [Francisellaceae bacterium]